mmetsp:Transcript_61500/g.68895  ORF Transcript_61500/g.68895 Transcript_61500/m.68895 type:complete len:102 (+) Transcript_61500:2-307(+)
MSISSSSSVVPYPKIQRGDSSRLAAATTLPSNPVVPRMGGLVGVYQQEPRWLPAVLFSVTAPSTTPPPTPTNKGTRTTLLGGKEFCSHCGCTVLGLAVMSR